MKEKSGNRIKMILGGIPYAPELYWMLRQRGKPIKTRFSLSNLENHIPELVDQISHKAETSLPGKRVLIFATLHYWIEQAALLGLTLAGLGHDCHLAYLPYSDWQKPISKFDLRRQNIYSRWVLEKCQPLLKTISLLDYQKSRSLPVSLQADVELVSYYDAQYTLQVETVDEQSDIYKMRMERNRFAAEKLLALCAELEPDVVVVPNGTIQELGVTYRVAMNLGIPVSTYEFSDQKDRIWLAQNSEIMRQDTHAIWDARKEIPFTDDQRKKVEALYQAKVQGNTWKNFVRKWQSTPREGGGDVANRLGLDDRPVVLLATNVLGDSLTLGRQVFSETMAEWIEKTVQFFAQRSDVQLVIRVHPGEVLTHGPSMVDVVNKLVANLPENIHLVGPRDQVNTYDLIDIADIGLVYTTTTGLEMAMSGLPVVVSGITHYKGNGFTHDPQSYEDYYKILNRLLQDPKNQRLNKKQIEQAWHYAYIFFFEYAIPFPWRVVNMWEDLKERPISYVFGEGMGQYSNTFKYITGTPIEW